MSSLLNDVPKDFITGFLIEYPRCALQHSIIFWYIANNNMCKTKDVMKALGQKSEQVIAKQLSRLGRGNATRDNGLGLIEPFENPEDYRQKVYRLTSMGRALYLKLTRG